MPIRCLSDKNQFAQCNANQNCKISLLYLLNWTALFHTKITDIRLHREQIENDWRDLWLCETWAALIPQKQTYPSNLALDERRWWKYIKTTPLTSFSEVVLDSFFFCFNFLLLSKCWLQWLWNNDTISAFSCVYRWAEHLSGKLRLFCWLNERIVPLCCCYLLLWR